MTRTDPTMLDLFLTLQVSAERNIQMAKTHKGREKKQFLKKASFAEELCEVIATGSVDQEFWQQSSLPNPQEVAA